MYHNFRHLLQRRCATITTTTTSARSRAITRPFSHYFSSQSSTNNFSDNPKNHQKNNNNNNNNNNSKKKKWSTTTLVITTTLLTSLTAYYSHMIYRDCIRGMPNTFHVHPNSPLSPVVKQLSEKYIFRPSWYLNNTHLQTIVNAMMGDELDERRTRVERRVLRLDGEYHVYLDYISAKNTTNTKNTKSDENTKKTKMGEKKKNFVLIIPGVFAGTEGVSVKQFINHTLSLNNDREENVCIVLNFTNNNNNQQNNQQNQKNFEENKSFENVENEQQQQSSSQSVRTVIPGLTHMDMSPELHSIIQHIYHNDVTTQQNNTNVNNSKNSQKTTNTNHTNNDNTTTRNELFVMGISLGSNIMCNYLGMYPHESHQMISAAVALCNPFDLVATTRHLSSLYHLSSHQNQNHENQNFENFENFSHQKSENTKNGKSRFSRVIHSFYDRQLLIKRKEMLSQNLHYFVQYFNHVHHVIMTMNHQQQQQQQKLQYDNNLNNNNNSNNNGVLHDVMSEWLNRIESTREFDSMFTIPLLHQHHSHHSHASHTPSHHSNNNNDSEEHDSYSDSDDSDDSDSDVMMMGLDDYYASQSSAHVMDRIRVPLLCIHARDDHISLWNSALSAMRTMDNNNNHNNNSSLNNHVVSHHTSDMNMNMNMIYPNNEHVAFLVSEYGGHVGWLGNTTIVDKSDVSEKSDKKSDEKSDKQKSDKRAPSWMQLVVMDYFDQMKQKSKQ